MDRLGGVRLGLPDGAINSAWAKYSITDVK